MSDAVWSAVLLIAGLGSLFAGALALLDLAPVKRWLRGE